MMHPPRLHPRSALLGAALAIGLTVAVPAPARADGLAVPAGWTATARSTPADGVEHAVLTRANPPTVVNVARIAPGAPVSLRAVLSRDRVAGDEGRLETTSSMCARVHCVLGVNADFAGVGTDVPLGGFVTDGELLRSPSSTHHQLSLTADGTLTDRTFAWSGELMATDLRKLEFHGVNVDRPAEGIVLYTPAFGPTTKTAQPGVDLVVRVLAPAGEFRLGQTSSVELLALHEDALDGPIPPDGAVLSGDGAGAEALRSLWARLQGGAASKVALLKLKTTDGLAVRESVGGSPILLRDGKRWFTDPGDNFTRGRHPRTLVGWNAAGAVLLVTVDGRQPGVSVGMSLFEATDLLLALGATEGINLDGGGSTTFVQRGQVVNSVSDVQVRRGGKTVMRHTPQKGDAVIGRLERPVASALVVVPSIAVSAPPVDPLADVALGLGEQALALPATGSDPVPGNRSRSQPPGAQASGDPASVPDGRLPALIGPRPQAGSPLMRVAVAVNLALLAVVAGAGLTLRRRGFRLRPGPNRRPGAGRA